MYRIQSFKSQTGLKPKQLEYTFSKLKENNEVS